MKALVEKMYSTVENSSLPVLGTTYEVDITRPNDGNTYWETSVPFNLVQGKKYTFFLEPEDAAKVTSDFNLLKVSTPAPENLLGKFTSSISKFSFVAAENYTTLYFFVVNSVGSYKIYIYEED